MRKLTFKQCKYAELNALKQSIEISINNAQININYPEKSLIMLCVSELYIVLSKKLLFADQNKRHTIKITIAQATALIAFMPYMQPIDDYTSTILLSFKETILKQII